MTIRSPAGDVDLLVDLPCAMALSAILPTLIASAGLPTGTALHLGVGRVEGSWALGRAPLLAGCLLSSVPQDEIDEIGPVNLSCVAGPDVGRWVALADRTVVIGRDSSCDLALDDPELSRYHASISATPSGLLLQDLQSVNGVKVEGTGLQQLEGGVLIPAGSLIRLGASVLRSGLDLEPVLLLCPDGVGHVAVARPPRVVPPFDYVLPTVVGPPPERTRRPIPVLAAVIGAVAGAAIAVVTGLWSFLLLAALGPVMMLTSSVSDRVSGRRSYREQCRLHTAALRAQQTLYQLACIADRDDAWDRYPDPATLARRARCGGSRLWERRVGDVDFLRLTVGVGERPARLALVDPLPVREVPITFDLGKVGVFGLAGDTRPLLRHLLSQLVTLHSPADLYLVIFSDHQDLHRMRELPHAADSAGTGPATSSSAAARVTRLLEIQPGNRLTVIVLDDAYRWRQIPRMNELLNRAAHQHHAAAGLTERSEPTWRGPAKSVVAICVARSTEALPVECAAVAVVANGLVRISAGARTINAELAGVTARYAEDIVSALAPLVDPDTPGRGLPSDVSLSGLRAGISIVDVMHEQWSNSSLRTAIGASAAGPLHIDLERDGPHMLIAGTTGSGKSELLQTLIIGLAMAAPPSRTSFLLIDYKGGAAFGLLADLPHTTGVVTDLDATLASRALMSLRAEVRRREQFLADRGATDMRALRAGAELRAPPSLVIVVDEFATLGAELPEFLTGLLDVAQRGRSLGLHLILATQRPSGVLTPAMKANIALRICLRVTDDADSVDVIDTAEAAHLSVELAGRAVLRRERSQTTVFQVARVTAATHSAHRIRFRDTGALVNPEAHTHLPATANDLEQVLAAARTAWSGKQMPAPPWLPALPQLIQARPGDRSIALIDRPLEQQQYPLDTPPGSLMVLGPPGSGRSNLLRRYAWCAAATGADLVVVDPAGGLAELAHWPTSRTHLNGEDPVLVQRLIARLQEELKRRVNMPGRPILLVVDGWEAIHTGLDALDYGATLTSLADLAGRGPASGLCVIISGELRLQHHRLATSFTSTIRLGVDHRGEPHASPAGRGFFGSAQIQCLLAAPGTAAPPPAPLLADLSEHCWVTGRAPVIRALPTVVKCSELPESAGATVPVGLGGDDGSPLSIDLASPGGGLLITGPRRSGVSNALTVLALGAAAAGITVLRACQRPLSQLVGVRDVDMRTGEAVLQRILVDHHGPILLIADDVDQWPDPAADLLERFVMAAGPGQYPAIGTRLDRAGRARRGPIAEVAALRTGIMLQADAADGFLLDAVLPRRRGHIGPGRGHLVLAGIATPVQVAVH